MLAPEFLTVEGLPHALRAIGTQVPVFLMVGFGVHWLYRYGERALPFSKTAFHGLVLLLLLSAASINLVKYFIFFNQSVEQKTSFTYVQKNIATYLATLPPGQQKYIVTNDRSHTIGNGIAVDLQPLVFYTYQKIANLHSLAPGKDIVIAQPSVIIMAYPNKEVVNSVLLFSPKAVVETIDYHPGTNSNFQVIHLP
jgi:hypothetical protein